MLNLNYNIIGSIGPRVERQGVTYQVRVDPFSSSLVLAMPGNLFVDGDYQNQFGMTNPWDDISAYVKAGPNNNPVGTNLPIIVSQSLTGASYINTSSFTLFGGGNSRYNESIYMNGANSLVVNQTWAATEGANLTFDKSFVFETYAAFIDTESATTSSFSPNRIFSWKYNPGYPDSASYFWYGNWGGDIDTGGGIQLVSGSTNFVYDYTQPPIPTTEANAWGITGSIITPLQWRHYAVSYTTQSYTQYDATKKLRVYIDGNLQGVYSIPDNREFNLDTNELLQVMGSVDASWTEGAYSGSAVYWQDFKLYNGTDKNYTGSIIPLPESMVAWQ